jgi:hypothetical protein
MRDRKYKINVFLIICVHAEFRYISAKIKLMSKFLLYTYFLFVILMPLTAEGDEGKVASSAQSDSATSEADSAENLAKAAGNSKEGSDKKKDDGTKKKKKKKSPLGAIGKIAGGGGGGGPVAALVGTLGVIPMQILEFSKLIATMNANLAHMRMASSNSNTPPEQTQEMTMQLDALVLDLQAKIMMFRQMPVFVMLDTLNKQCGSPVMTVAMGVPGAGQVVASLCGKIGAMDLKVDMLIGRAELLLANALTAKEAMFMRMKMAQASVSGGMTPPEMPSNTNLPEMPSNMPHGIGGDAPSDASQEVVDQ